MGSCGYCEGSKGAERVSAPNPVRPEFVEGLYFLRGELAKKEGQWFDKLSTNELGL